MRAHMCISISNDQFEVLIKISLLYLGFMWTDNFTLNEKLGCNYNKLIKKIYADVSFVQVSIAKWHSKSR